MKPVKSRARASAPAKVILFGEHFVVYNKPAILASVDRRIYVDVKVRDDDIISIKSNIGFDGSFNSDKCKQLLNKPFKTLVQPILTSAIDAMNEFDGKIGLDISVNAQFPYGVGLGSSAACSIATIAAVSALFDKLSRKKICDMSLNVEKLVHGTPSGADSAICTYGGLMLFDRVKGARPINSKVDIQLIIANSGIQRITGKLVSEVKERSAKEPGIFMGLANISENITIQALQAIKARDYGELGALMTLNHSLLRRLGVSTNMLDKLVQKALSNGALGAKMTGAGGGGCIIALTNKTSTQKVIRALRGYEAFVSRVENDGVIIA